MKYNVNSCQTDQMSRNGYSPSTTHQMSPSSSSTVYGDSTIRAFPSTPGLPLQSGASIPEPIHISTQHTVSSLLEDSPSMHSTIGQEIKVDERYFFDINQDSIEADVDDIIGLLEEEGTLSTSEPRRRTHQLLPRHSPLQQSRSSPSNPLSSHQHSPNLYALHNNNSSSNSSNCNVSKKKKKKSKTNSTEAQGLSYFAPKHLRAQGNIQISKLLTEQLIPTHVREPISNVYHYMDMMTTVNCYENAINLDLTCSSLHRAIFHYGFHSKQTGEPLYCVVERQDAGNNKSRGYKWKMLNFLFTAKQLQQHYHTTTTQLPQFFQFVPRNISLSSFLSSCSKVISASLFPDAISGNTGTNITTTTASIDFSQLIRRTPWHKLNIYRRINNKRRLTLSLTKPEFMNSLTELCRSMKNLATDFELIPILVFNHDLRQYLIEHVWVVHLESDIDIGIGFSITTQPNLRIRVTGIHLDQRYLVQQFRLLFPSEKHTPLPHALRNFQSNITDLHIGNPDDNLNKIKYYKLQVEELTSCREQLLRLLHCHPSHREVVVQDIQLAMAGKLDRSHFAKQRASMSGVPPLHHRNSVRSVRSMAEFP